MSEQWPKTWEIGTSTPDGWVDETYERNDDGSVRQRKYVNGELVKDEVSQP
jgi:hypothetical protein